ncbi:MAG: DUF4352 domain-containing protein [Actinobacteria bacterium]|jgi:hypothetical protein|nr:DUF4352 domain-containing protein [Actinomycetota bacterium]
MHTGIKKAGIAAVAALAIFATMGEASSSGDAASEPATDASAAPGQEEAATEEEAPADEVAAELGVGDEARDGKFAFTVSKIKCGVKEVGGEFLNEKAQGQFCLVTMNVKNIGDESQLFDASSQKGRTDTGATVDADSTASLYANQEGGSFLEEINPGNSLEDIIVVYDIAKDQKLTALELHDSMFSDGILIATK